MNIHIIGAGAMGLLYGGHLARAGENVTFWTRSESQRKVLLEQGVYIEEADGVTVSLEASGCDVHVFGNNSDTGVQCGQQEAAEWILIAVKQNHLDENLLATAAYLAGLDTRIVCLQNGVGHIDQISAALGGRQVYSLITTEGSTKLADNRVRRAGRGETRLGISKLQIHSGFDVENDACIKTLLKALEKAGFPALLSNDIDRDIYRKLLINSVINPLTAILRVPNGDLLVKEERLTMIGMLCAEVELVYQACGISMDADALNLVIGVCQATSKNTSSMLGDVLHHRVTEIDAINGQLLILADSVGIEIPFHKALWLLVKSMHPQEHII